MNQTKATLIKKYGSLEAYRQHMRDIRKQVKHHGGGAFNNPDFAKRMSKKGVEARQNAINKNNPPASTAD